MSGIIDKVETAVSSKLDQSSHPGRVLRTRLIKASILVCSGPSFFYHFSLFNFGGKLTRTPVVNEAADDAGISSEADSTIDKAIDTKTNDEIPEGN